MTNKKLEDYKRNSKTLWKPYRVGTHMIRWNLFPRNPLFSLYLHKIVGSDQRELHDHPKRSLSFVLRGYAVEHHWTPTGLDRHVADPTLFNQWDAVRRISPGKFYYRSARFSHSIKLESRKRPVWTLFLMFGPNRDWGFWRVISPFFTHKVVRWVDHDTFIKAGHK